MTKAVEPSSSTKFLSSATQHRFYGGPTPTSPPPPSDQNSLGPFKKLPHEITRDIFKQERPSKKRSICTNISSITTAYTQDKMKTICLNLIRNTIKTQSKLENLNTDSHNLSSMPHVINKIKEPLQSQLTQLTNRLNMFFNLFGDTLDLSETNITDTELEILIKRIPEGKKIN